MRSKDNYIHPGFEPSDTCLVVHIDEYTKTITIPDGLRAVATSKKDGATYAHLKFSSNEHLVKFIVQHL